MTGVGVLDRITVDPAIHHGAPVIAGTRVPAAVVVGSLAGGMTREEVMREYEVTGEDIDAALAYAADLVSRTELVPLG